MACSGPFQKRRMQLSATVWFTKTEFCSWRVSTDLTAGLESEARRRKISISAVLDLAALDWLSKGNPGLDSNEEQVRLQ